MQKVFLIELQGCRNLGVRAVDRHLAQALVDQRVQCRLIGEQQGIDVYQRAAIVLLRTTGGALLADDLPNLDWRLAAKVLAGAE